MDLNRLPFLPLHFFYQKFPPLIKRIFLACLFLLIICGVGTLVFYQNPYLLSLPVQEIAETEEAQLRLFEIKENFRTVPVDFGVFKQWITYSAGPILPQAGPLAFFLIFQWIGWTLLLAIGTTMKSRWFYLVYGLFAFFLHFSGISGLIVPDDPYLIFEFAIVASFLGLAYTFQMSMLRWSFIYRWLTFALLALIYLAVAISISGTEALFSIPASLFLYLSAISLFLLLFVAKEPTNLIIFGATNRRNVSSRLSPGIILMTMFVLFITEFFWEHEVMDLNWFENSDWMLRPAHFVIPSLILTIFLSQNQFQKVAHMFTTNIVFTFSLVCLSLIVMSFMMYFFASGDQVFLNFVDRWASVAFLAVGLGHMFYLFTNFMPLLQRRVHLYYLLAGGQKFSFAVVWIIALSALVISEGAQSWKTPRYILHGISVSQGDLHFRKQELQDAAETYEVSTFALNTSTKANYNQAAIALAQGKKVEDIFPYYQAANKYQPFPYAYINGANLLWVSGYQTNATEFLQTAKSEHPHIYTNLGRYYALRQQSDSAIISFKKALLQDLNLGPAYANMAHIYEQEGKQKEADEFYQAAYEVSPTNQSVQINSLYYSLLREKESISIDADTTQPYLLHNLALAALRSGNTEKAFSTLSQSSDDNLSLESLLLKAWLEFEAASLDKSLSRFTFYTESYPNDAAPAFMKMGHLYFKNQNPEMAKLLYQKAGESGDPNGYLMEALMMLDTQQADSAYFKLVALRSSHGELYEPIAKEVGMLLKAYSQGDETYASTEWDLSTLSRDEQVRISLYADSVDLFSTALNNFRGILENDYSFHSPYVEMSKIYQRYQNPDAETVILNGLESTAQHPDLQLQLATVYAQSLKMAKADSLLKLLPDSISSSADFVQTQAVISLSQGDTATAYNSLENFHTDHPLEKGTLLLMADILHTQENYDQGIVLMNQAIGYNTEVPEFWYYYGLFSKGFGMTEDVEFALERVQTLSKNDAFVSLVREQLKIEVIEE